MARQNHWTAEEEQYLRDNVETKSYAEIAEHVGKTPEVVRRKTSYLKLGVNRNRLWTEKEIRFLKTNAKKLTLKQAAEKLGRTEKAVTRVASLHKISFGNYTQEEIDYILENSTKKTISTIAKKLGRTETAIWMKMIHLGCTNQHYEAGTYSSRSLSEVIGVSPGTVINWIRKRGLPAVKRARYESSDISRVPYHITSEDFWSWAEKNKDAVRFNKIKRNSLLPEPEWVEEERTKQYYEPVKFKSWTIMEDQELINLYYREGLTQREVAKRINRTLGSVEVRLSTLRKRGVKI